jgi:putative salt-induced outer membrane protein
VNSDAQQLDLEFGLGARQTRYTDNTSNNVLIERLSSSYLWKFADKSNFSENLSLEHGSDNTYIQSVTALTTNLAGSFALSLSYTVKHNSTVLPGFKNTDTITAVSLVYSF